MMDAQALIILSNIDGIYNGSPSDPASAVIREIEHGKDLSNYIQATKSSFGRGGMLTKTNIARKVADEGITVIIANGKRDNILVDLLQQPDDTVCTRFIPSTEAVSSVKKWIAHSEGFAKGEIHINECATDILSSEKAASILPVGIMPAYAHMLHGSSIERNSQRNISPSFMIMKMQIDRISLEEIINNIFKMVIEFF